MDVAPVNLSPLISARSGLRSGERGPLRALGALDSVPGARPRQADDSSRLRQHAERLVAQTFYGTLLKQMRDSPFKSELFSGGRGGQAFSALLDQQLAERMSKNVAGKLVNSIVKRLESAAQRNGGAELAHDLNHLSLSRDDSMGEAP